jgi:hypothetical protein
VAEFDIRKEKAGAFARALGASKKGDVIIYHEGDNMLGCPHRRDAMVASDAGKVSLVLKKVAIRNYLFMAQRTGVK